LAAAPAADQAPSAKPGIANPTASPRHSLLRKYARPTAIPFPLNNAYTKDREFLGKSLLFLTRAFLAAARLRVLHATTLGFPGEMASPKASETA